MGISWIPEYGMALVKKSGDEMRKAMEGIDLSK
jgi:hypothetical protein